MRSIGEIAIAWQIVDRTGRAGSIELSSAIAICQKLLVGQHSRHVDRELENYGSFKVRIPHLTVGSDSLMARYGISLYCKLSDRLELALRQTLVDAVRQKALGDFGNPGPTRRRLATILRLTG
jgi:hypothetical protein